MPSGRTVKLDYSTPWYAQDPALRVNLVENCGHSPAVLQLLLCMRARAQGRPGWSRQQHKLVPMRVGISAGTGTG